MTEPAFQRRLVASLFLAGALCAVAGFAWLCNRSDTIAFLPARKGATWIVPPAPASAEMHRDTVLTARFQRHFELAEKPARAHLAVRAFRHGAVLLNGAPVASLTLEGHRWKLPTTVDIASLLQSGSNRIEAVVSNELGPPALWLHLELPSADLGTDASWAVSQEEDTWQPARPADEPTPIVSGSYLDGQGHLLPHAGHAGVAVVVLAVIALMGAMVWRRKNPPPAWGLALIAVVWTALFVNNLPQLPRIYGFDAEGHEEYIRYIQERGTLPLADEGWQMYQPPLYYAVAAFALDVVGLSTAEDESVLLLRAANGLVGLAHCALVFLCLRRLFPSEPWKQAAGTLVAGFLPAHLYLSHYATNETVSALFVTAAVYFVLRALPQDADDPLASAVTRAGGPLKSQDCLFAGLALGAALLTKFSAVLAVPVLLGALVWPWVTRRGIRPTCGLRGLGVFLMGTLFVCGWHYIRVWMHFGRPLVGNWDAGTWTRWWQDPGYRTAAYYTSFGEALAQPLFSSFSSFADGLYATLWGDGLAGSAAWMAFRPPWNHDFMAIIWLAALLPTFLAVAGFGVCLARALRRPDAPTLLLTGLPIVFALGLVFMSLRVPSYAQVKAFYALPVLLPLCFMIVTGWDWLGTRLGRVRPVLDAGMITWMLCIPAAFWVRAGHAETAVVQGIWALDRGRVADAVEFYTQALERDPHNAAVLSALTEGVRARPDDAHMRSLLALALQRVGRPTEARDHYHHLLYRQPDHPQLLNNLAWLLATSPDDAVRDGAEAVRLAERACELTGQRELQLLGTLAAAYAEAGRFEESLRAAETARTLALQAGLDTVAARNAVLMELYRAGNAYREPQYAK